MRDHLMACGNKTDQCPNCRRFIRRAVFTYHYENNCANLDEANSPRNTPPRYRPVRPSSRDDIVLIRSGLLGRPPPSRPSHPPTRHLCPLAHLI